MENKRKRFKHLALSLCLTIAMIVGLTAVSFAAESNEKVIAAKSGVVHIRVIYQGNDGDYFIQWGSGFLINDMTILTCRHVIYVEDSVLDDMRADPVLGPSISGKTNKQLREKMAYKVMVESDSTISAEIIEGVESEKSDFAALRIKTAMGGYTHLAIRDTEKNPVKETEECYVLGFPGKMTYFNEMNFSRSKVEVSPGQVQKMDLDVSRDNVMTIFSSAPVTDGYSGGPMVDSDGNVVGVAYSASGDLATLATESHAVASQQFLPVLTTCNVDFTTADMTPDAAVDEEESAEDTEEVPAPASVTEPVEEKPKTNYLPFVLGGIGIVALLGILAAVLIIRGKKKNDPLKSADQTYAAGNGPIPAQPVTSTGNATTPAAPSVPPAMGGYAGSPTPDTSVLNQGSNETTVLGQGAGETSVLAGIQDCGSLTREKTGERIPINKDNFKIGRERSRVDYCVSDNTAIGRHHATIITRNNESYLVDEKSRNFTFVNDVKAAPKEEIKLKDGDKISFGDETYVFNSK
ncbi:MAG: trypsin-like peptidase domain-containing protein [Mogibacterium sp.]|nr:trypsin-like peptidase domain-containing protein [Mogibacterium sp.]